MLGCRTLTGRPGEVTNHLSIGTASSCSAKIVKGLDAGEQVVDNSHDDNNTD